MTNETTTDTTEWMVPLPGHVVVRSVPAAAVDRVGYRWTKNDFIIHAPDGEILTTIRREGRDAEFTIVKHSDPFGDPVYINGLGGRTYEELAAAAVNMDA